eukprot:3001570-Lingulodinium_polyedra.AAC.1
MTARQMYLKAVNGAAGCGRWPTLGKRPAVGLRAGAAYIMPINDEMHGIGQCLPGRSRAPMLD